MLKIGEKTGLKFGPRPITKIMIKYIPRPGKKLTLRYGLSCGPKHMPKPTLRFM